MRAESDDDVAHVVQALFQIVIIGFGEQLGVLTEQPVQRGWSVHALFDDPVTDFVGKRSIAQNRLVNGKNSGLVVAHLSFDFAFQSTKFHC